ncbi:MAG: PVC-type heme-binding CxxCH protein, partial [Opitutaceae bacterium]
MTTKNIIYVCIGLVLSGAAGVMIARGQPEENIETAPSSPVPADRALETIEVRPGLKLELAASEPLVINPIAMSFDQDGRLFVVEMLDYPNRELGDGRIRLLEDTDNDGKYDRATVYADGMSWPSGLHCYAGGLFVAATPDLLYLRDVDGDNRADIREVVF